MSAWKGSRQEQWSRTPRGKYRSQKVHAKKRGIGWEFTFETWWAVWQRSGRWSQRGKRAGCYVMARHGDKGPYARWNVSIIPHEQNASEGGNNVHKLPMGVTLQAGRYFKAGRSINGKWTHLGYFPTPELAHAAYLMAGEQRAAA